MSEQNFSNHGRMHPLYHYVTAPLVVAGLIGSIVNLFKSTPATHYSAALLVIVFLILLFIGAMLRTYSLKAQDRAIRAEESLRHFVLTGKPLDARLRMGQIVALRFASDAEFPALAQKAADENLSGKQIKQAIQNWRADFYRV
jgi:ABC-type transport system involved in cytochrome bd biosynthesis fused ATPase/permease subunit